MEDRRQKFEMLGKEGCTKGEDCIKSEKGRWKEETQSKSKQ